MASAARARPDLRVVEPAALRGVTLDSGQPDDLSDSPADTTLEVGEDGGVTITLGGRDQAPPRPSRFDDNLAERIDDSTLAALAGMLLEGIESDKQSRAEWQETADRAAKYLGINIMEPSTAASSDGTICKTVATCLMEALVKLWSTARAELLPVGGPVKVKRDDLPTMESTQPGGSGGGAGGGLGGGLGGGFSGVAAGAPGGGAAPAAPAAPGGIAGAQTPKLDRDKLANALEQDLNWFLTVGDREYYPDTSKMILHRYLIGNAFKKVYRCPLRRRPASVWVKAQNLIVSNDCSHLSHAGRVTEVIRLRQATMRRMQASGHYLDVPLAQPTGEVTQTELAESEFDGIAAQPGLPADYEHLVYECSVELDSATMDGLAILDRDERGRKPGYPLPYRVTIEADSRQVLEIRRDWEEGDEDHQRARRYVKYGMIPGLGFYDYGLIHLCGNPTLAATMLQRAGVDSALFSNFPGGMFLQGAGTRDKTMVVRPNPGEWVGMNGGGVSKITDLLMPMPYRPPSPESMALNEKFEAQVRALAGVVDLPVGEGRIGNTPVGTMMSYVESVSQVPSAVHKDDHVAQAEEFDLLRRLFVKEPEALTRGNRSPARKQWLAAELEAPDLIPCADPNTPSAVHRLMKLQALVQLGGLPQFGGIADNRAIYEHAVELLGTGDPTDFTMPAQAPMPPPPDPRIVAAQIKAQSQQQSDAAKTQQAAMSHQERMAELQQEGVQRDADRQSDETRAAMSLEAARLKATHDTANAAADRAHATANAGADRTVQAGIAGAQLAQKHAQHLNELGLAAAGQQQEAAGAAEEEGAP